MAAASNPFVEGANRLSYVGGQSGFGTASILSIVATIVNIVLGLLGVVFLVLTIVAGVRWMLSGGDQEKIKQARSTIVHSVVGLAIVLAALAISLFITSTLGQATGTPLDGYGPVGP